METPGVIRVSPSCFACSEDKDGAPCPIQTNNDEEVSQSNEEEVPKYEITKIKREIEAKIKFDEINNLSKNQIKEKYKAIT